MKRIAILLSILMLLPALGCAVKAYSGEIKADLGQQVELKPGQTVSIEEEHVKVKFIEVVNDSRCPEGATCIWAGKVSCIVEITYMGSIQRETLTNRFFHRSPQANFLKSIALHLACYLILNWALILNQANIGSN